MYREVGIPYNRFREEILNFAPRLSMLYDVISHREIEEFKDLAKEKVRLRHLL